MTDSEIIACSIVAASRCTDFVYAVESETDQFRILTVSELLGIMCERLEELKQSEELNEADKADRWDGYWIEEPGKIPHCPKCGHWSEDADVGGFFSIDDPRNNCEINYCANCGAHLMFRH